MMHRPPWPNGQAVGLLIRRLRVLVPPGVVAHSKQCSEADVMGKRSNLGADPTSSVRGAKDTASDRLRLFPCDSTDFDSQMLHGLYLVQPAAWSSRMILALVARCPEFNSRSSPSMTEQTIMTAALGNDFRICALKT